MKRASFTVAVLMFVACAHTTVPTGAPVTPAPPPASVQAAPPCNPGLSIVNATLWMQKSAEYEALSLQAFASARRALDQALADPNWIGATEETAGGESQPPAIILDLDETALDNSAFEVRAIRAGKTFDQRLWTEWVNAASAGAVPGAADFLNYAKSRGVTPFYVTNRDFPEEESGTMRNLQKLGYPLDPKVDTLLMRAEREAKTSDKSPRRAFVASNYRVLLLLGDDLNDFITASGKSQQEREEIMRRTASWWGTRWFILPNPIYGSWEKAASPAGKTPCETLQNKMDALRAE